MQDKSRHPELSFREFVAMMALMMSIVALSIDSVLPALGVIGSELAAKNSTDTQLLVVYLFIGLAVGQLFFGPLSDAIGRRRAISIGFVVFFIGTVISLSANDMAGMLVGRFLQGVGLSSPRTVSIAIVRDLYEGRQMASVMSFIMMIFILVPMIAPLLGQLVLAVTNWQGIFLVMLLVGAVALGWYLLRQGETLPVAVRAPFTAGRVLSVVRFMLAERSCLFYILAVGVTNGPFIFYLSSAQQLFEVSYGLGQWFPLYFAGLSFTIGISSFINGKNVVKFGRRNTAKFALLATVIGSTVFSGVSLYYEGLPPLWLSTAYLMAVFLCVGLMSGNLNALAMDNLGHIAGIGSAIVGSLSTLISALFAIVVGYFFNGAIYPLVLAFLVAGIIALGLIYGAEAVTAIDSNAE